MNTQQDLASKGTMVSSEFNGIYNVLIRLLLGRLSGVQQAPN
jgi:hypothetical protein